MKKLLSITTLFALGALQTASAAVPAEVSTAAAEMTADVPLYVAVFIPVLAAGLIGGIAFKLSKRFGNKAI